MSQPALPPRDGAPLRPAPETAAASWCARACLRLRPRSLTLFWRNFLAFWFGMALIVGIAMALTASVAWYRFNALDGLNPASLTQDALQVSRVEGREGLQRWLRALDSSASALQIYVVDMDGRDILDRTLQTRLKARIDEIRTHPEELLPASAHPAGARVSWWDPQLLPMPDGDDLLLMFLPFDSSRWEVLHLSPVAIVLAVFALAVSAPLCWALTRHVTQPVRLLRDTARALSQGRLGERTPESLAGRRDELGAFARDFDAMAAQLQTLVDSHERLLRSVAHELRSPLTRLQLSTELARRNDASLPLQLDRIEREAQRLDGLIAQALELARTGAAAHVPEPVDVTPRIDAIIDDARFEAQARGVRIDWEPPGPVIAMADAASLDSAIENVVRNAVRHGSRPGMAIHVSLEATPRRIHLSVRDSGPGVAPALLPLLFEPFFRAPAPGSVPVRGSGLGLSIARAAMTAHGGGMSAENAPGGGLLVRLWLPGRDALSATNMTPAAPREFANVRQSVSA